MLGQTGDWSCSKNQPGDVSGAYNTSCVQSPTRPESHRVCEVYADVLDELPITCPLIFSNSGHPDGG